MLQKLKLVVLVYKALHCFWLSLNEPCFMHIDTINISSNVLCAFLFLKYSISMSEHSKFFPINCDMHISICIHSFEQKEMRCDSFRVLHN
jgi:hypothetical protein